jgi:hypothetical protein
VAAISARTKCGQKKAKKYELSRASNRRQDLLRYERAMVSDIAGDA